MNASTTGLGLVLDCGIFAHGARVGAEKVDMCISMYLSIYKSTYLSFYLCISIHLYIYISIHLYIYVYIYISRYIPMEHA